MSSTRTFKSLIVSLIVERGLQHALMEAQWFTWANGASFGLRSGMDWNPINLLLARACLCLCALLIIDALQHHRPRLNFSHTCGDDTLPASYTPLLRHASRDPWPRRSAGTPSSAWPRQSFTLAAFLTDLSGRPPQGCMERLPRSPPSCPGQRLAPPS